MQRFSNTQNSFNTRKGLTREGKEILELKKTVAQLEQTVMEINFSKAIIVKENEDKSHQIEKLKKEVENLKREKESESEKHKKEKENEILKIKQDNEIEVGKVKKENEIEIFKIKSENENLVEKLRREIEMLRREKEIETEILKKEKESEVLRIKEEFENEKQKGQKDNVEFIYKLKSEFFPATPYVETKLIEENREKVKKLEQEKQNLRLEIERLNKASSTVLRSRSTKKI